MGVNPIIEVRSISDMPILGYLDLWEMWKKTYLPDFAGFFFQYFIIDIPKEHFRVENSTPQHSAKKICPKKGQT